MAFAPGRLDDPFSGPAPVPNDDNNNMNNNTTTTNNNNNGINDPTDPNPDLFTMRGNQAALVAWQERQRRQRTLRMLMMFLMMLLLMDAEEPPDSNRRNPHHRKHNTRRGYDSNSRGRDSPAKWREFGIYLDANTGMIPPLNPEVYDSRRGEDELILEAFTKSNDNSGNERYNYLKMKNKERNVESELRNWAEQKFLEEARTMSKATSIMTYDHFSFDEEDEEEENENEEDDDGTGTANPERNVGEKTPSFEILEERIKQLDDLPVFHFPRNATGYYRGLWLRIPVTNTTVDKNEIPSKSEEKNNGGIKSEIHPRLVSTEEIHPWVQKQLAKQQKDVALLLLPPDIYLDANSTASMSLASSNGKPNNSTTAKGEPNSIFPPTLNADESFSGFFPSSSGGESSPSAYLRQSSTYATSTGSSSTKGKPSISLTKEAGRAAFHLYSRPIPAMNEISIVDGLVKLYDGTTVSFVSRRTDVLLRVRGVMIHGIGKMSLVTSTYSPSSDGWVSPAGMRRRSVLGVRQVHHEKGEVAKEGHHDSLGGDKHADGESGGMKKEDKINDAESSSRQRRLQETIDGVTSQSGGVGSPSKSILEMMTTIREDVMHLYASHYANDLLNLGKGEAFPEKAMKKDGWTLLQTVDEGDELLGDIIDDSSIVHRLLQAVPGNVATKSENPSPTALSGDDGSFSVGNSTGTDNTTALSNLNENIIDSSVEHQSVLFEGYDEDVDDGSFFADKSPATESNTVLTPYLDETIIDSSIVHRSALSEGGISHKPSTASRYVYPFPYLHDDAEDSIKKSSSPATRRVSSREQVSEANAANCEFEINFDVQESKWTYGEWRKTLEHRLKTVQAFNPYWSNVESLNGSGKDNSDSTELSAALMQMKKSQFLLIKSQLDFLEQDPPKEALVMTMMGNIESQNCNFNSFVNVTAIRTNLELTTAKAINYSFYMMLTCLTQIVVLLRQLLHTQAQSAASNVSLTCIGWQTVLDAILCIGHIFLCLVMQSLITAFASVAFFKLLIFCVIEMKYMAIIIQARNTTNNTGQTQEDLRRQITLLHLRFYGALMAAIILFWFFGQAHLTFCVLLLYSFWVPQIVMNVITESRKPMHPYYIYGMSFTRSIAPLYTYGIESNFLKEVNPDFPTDLKMCQLLILWICFQTAILIAQGKYGARFMIPQRFLPPKFDYSRPIPQSLLPRPSPIANSSNGSPSEIELGPLLNGDASPTRERSTARNRRGGGNRARLGSRTEETNATTMSTEDTDTPTLDCVICYNEIDVNDRKGYMLAPCDHIFHRPCLEQWMEVKMECPICRKALPSI